MTRPRSAWPRSLRVRAVGPGGPRRSRTTHAQIRAAGHFGGDSSHAGHHPSVVASGWGSPVSAASAAALRRGWRGSRSPWRRSRCRRRRGRRMRGRRRSRSSANWSMCRIQRALIRWIATQGRCRPRRVHRWSYRQEVIGCPLAYRSSCPPGGACRSRPCSIRRPIKGGRDRLPAHRLALLSQQDQALVRVQVPRAQREGAAAPAVRSRCAAATAACPAPGHRP